MRLSESLRKGAMEAFRGGLVNKFKIRRRRVTLFFGDIFIGYVRACEKSGYKKEMEAAGQKWMVLYFRTLVPSAMKKLPISLLNMIMKKVWVNIGLMDDFNMEKNNNVATIKTANEAISKAIGDNGFSIGLYKGILNVLYESGAETVSAKQSAESSAYVFRITGKDPGVFEGKDKAEYDKLNTLKGMEGFALKDAFKSRILELKEGNKIYFRGRPVYPVENTIFHIIGNAGVLLDKVQEISFEFFRGLVEPETSDEKKLVLLKTLLQTMGWGALKIAVRDKEIEIGIENPPFGLQRERDNWEFLARAILGYLWLIDKKFRIKHAEEKGRRLRITYSR